MDTRVLRLTTPPMRGLDVKAWQEFLASQHLYRGLIDGIFGPVTEEATEAYQRRVGLPVEGMTTQETMERAVRDGFLPSVSNREHYRLDSDVVLSWDSRRKLDKIADEFYLETGNDLHIKSGTRTPARQAEAMLERLEFGGNFNDYTDRRAAREIMQAYREAQAEHATRRQIVAAMTEVIERQVTHHEYVSEHLLGGAIDVSVVNLTSSEQEALSGSQTTREG